MNRNHDFANFPGVPGGACPRLESAALFALGSLEEAEALEFAAHLESGCRECERELAAHAETIARLDQLEAEEDLAHDATLAPSEALRSRLQQELSAEPSRAKLDRVWQRWVPIGGETIAPGLVNVPSSSEGWQPTGIGGISVRQLSIDEVRRNVSMLVRMEPGTSYPRHRHAAREECYVVSGDLQVGSSRLKAGDYQVADENSIHDVQSTENGCLLFIVSSQDDELL